MAERSTTPDARKVAQLRGEQELTQETLASNSSVSIRTIQKIEAGLPISLTSLAAVARALGYQLDDLIAEPPIDRYDGVRTTEISFETLINERRRGFVGRKAVFKKLDQFLDDASTPSGYFVVEGDPGIGKSAWSAELVGRRHLQVYHFNVAAQGITTPRHFLGNICSRLIRSFKLPYYELPSGFDQDGQFIATLLYEAAGNLSPDDELVIAIDALDEAEAVISPRANPLFLPSELPRHVYVVVTARRGYAQKLRGSIQVPCTMEADSRDNKDDIREYVGKYIGLPGIKKWMSLNDLDKSRFVDHMLSKSEGNFMYLHYVIPAIDRGDLQDMKVAHLPCGLLAYYQYHWQRMLQRAPRAFEDLYHPVICVFAAAGEAWPISEVASITQLPMHRVSQVVREWREFFEVIPREDELPLYRLYHSTFAEFLSREIDPGLQTYHRLIADSLLDQAREPEEGS